MSELTPTFEAIIDTVQGKAPPVGSSEIPADEAYTEFQTVLSRTILPRRITLKGAEGAQISVIGKNRRIVNLSEVHPEAHWTGETSPEKTECQAGYAEFAGPFASALVKAVGDKPIRIEQALLTDSLKASGAGYPVSMLAEHIEQSQKRAPADDQVVSFFEANDGLPRARFGNEVEVTIPAEASITHDWMQARIDEVREQLGDKETDLRFIVVDGEKPIAFAMAWLDGEGAIVLSDDPEKFNDLENKLSALRAYL